MAKYMRNKFPFVGIKTPARKQQSKELIKLSKKMNLIDLMDVINNLYLRREREYQYVAIDVSIANVERFSFTEIKALAQYVTQKPWWIQWMLGVKCLKVMFSSILLKKRVFLKFSTGMIFFG
ncbi:hypothetical protein FD46_GL001130 [Liquorilactobacillus oeni DSM 19972]|uniref:Uncharacterized protein n=1 Tax=Liquorilactobacillus oeni DSM 19972 TaxID=1423777 RepID=A0A0R1MKX5_9LACO|nr:hypothetical protein FD46_GL001130 [Liquorilactobacillus oeni DSM 19972]